MKTFKALFKAFLAIPVALVLLVYLVSLIAVAFEICFDLSGQPLADWYRAMGPKPSRTIVWTIWLVSAILAMEAVRLRRWFDDEESAEKTLSPLEKLDLTIEEFSHHPHTRHFISPLLLCGTGGSVELKRGEGEWRGGNWYVENPLLMKVVDSLRWLPGIREIHATSRYLEISNADDEYPDTPLVPWITLEVEILAVIQTAMRAKTLKVTKHIVTREEEEQRSQKAAGPGLLWIIAVLRGCQRALGI